MKLYTNWHTAAQAEAGMRDRLPGQTVDRLTRAIGFAAQRHGDQRRLADRASNVQTLRNLSAARQRSYYAQTVRYIMPLADREPWFRAWYASWQAAHADIAATLGNEAGRTR